MKLLIDLDEQSGIIRDAQEEINAIEEEETEWVKKLCIRKGEHIKTCSDKKCQETLNIWKHDPHLSTYVE